jgi:hypothetical protein
MIEQDPTTPKHLLSIRGTGYRFVREPTPETVDESAGPGSPES